VVFGDVLDDEGQQVEASIYALCPIYALHWTEARVARLGW
jgi:hypothetical protein